MAPFVLVVLTALPLQEAAAFKIDTHVWVAQQVLNDLEDGSLDFQVGARKVTVSVHPLIRNSILKNPEAFRLGSVGPDAFPGIYEGQMTIHPGSEGRAWGTGDWLAHLVESAGSADEVAFSFGFMTHAAADVFAHSYVNHYAGDIYLLTDAEVQVELRHFLLEGYIAEHMPPLLKADGTPLGAPAEQIKRNGSLALPPAFLRTALVDNPTAAAQFAANGSPHLAAVHTLNQTLRDLTREGGPLDRLHMLSQQIAAYYYTGLEVNEKQLKEFNELHQRVRNLENSAIDEAQQLDSRIRSQVQANMRNAHEAVDDALGEAQSALAKLLELHEKMQQVEQDLAKDVDALRALADPPCRVIDTGVCSFSCPSVRTPFGRVEEPSCVAARRTCRSAGRHLREVCDIHAQRPGLESAVKLKQAAENKLKDDITQSMRAFKDAVAKVHTAVESYYEAEGKILHASIDLAQRFHKDVNPVRGIFTEWLEDNHRAMDAYFVANGTAMYNSLTHQDIMAPLNNWVSCWSPALVGIPSQIPQASCAARNAYGDIKAALEAIETLAVVNDPILAEVRKIRAQIEEDLKKAVSEELYRFGERVTGVDVRFLVDALKTPPTRDMLNAAYTAAPAEKPLLLLDAFADRVDAEMHLVDGKFDPSQYAVIYNAVTLAKLALLDANGLNKLAGSQVYSGDSFATANAMPGLASSIDGDYQWLPLSPPYARRVGEHDGPNRYGYPAGWPFWADEGLRTKVFRALFHGPLAPGLSQDVLPANYPYVPDPNCPFPVYPHLAGGSVCD